jgi:hypothetical protein
VNAQRTFFLLPTEIDSTFLDFNVGLKIIYGCERCIMKRTASGTRHFIYRIQVAANLVDHAFRDGSALRFLCPPPVENGKVGGEKFQINLL